MVFHFKDRRILMKNLIKAINLFLLVLLLTGCAKTVVRADSDPNVNFTSLNKFYVQKSPTDNRGLEKKIAGKLNELGFQATYGIDSPPKGTVDAIVTYKDKWMWDITMYMLELNIELHNPDSNYIFATGESYRTSLVRKSPDEMVDEVLRKIFAGKVDLTNNQKSNNKGE
jgi:hypothetical protein